MLVISIHALPVTSYFYIISSSAMYYGFSVVRILYFLACVWPANTLWESFVTVFTIYYNRPYQEVSSYIPLPNVRSGMICAFLFVNTCLFGSDFTSQYIKYCIITDSICLGLLLILNSPFLILVFVNKGPTDMEPFSQSHTFVKYLTRLKVSFKRTADVLS